MEKELARRDNSHTALDIGFVEHTFDMCCTLLLHELVYGLFGERLVIATTTGDY
jgi:hypothetical protein